MFSDKKVVTGTVTDEQLLIKKAQEGNREALDALVTGYWQPIYRLIYSKVRNEEDARELTQDTFMNAFRALPRYKIMDVSFKSYLGRIAINLVTDFWRKKGRRLQSVTISDYQESIVDTGENPEEHTLRVEGQEQIGKLVEELPEQQRQTIKLRVILGLSLRDTALKMNKSESAIKMLQQRALKRLREMCLSSGIVG